MRIILLLLTLISSAAACVPVTLRLTTDQYPEETSVLLEDQVGDEDFWGDFQFENDEFEYTLEACIDQSSCYQFVITDSAGDGICCSFGDGSFELSYDGTVVYSGGSHSSRDTFSLGDGCAAS